MKHLQNLHLKATDENFNNLVVFINTNNVLHKNDIII